MKKYIITAGVFLLIAGMVNARTVNKTGTGNAVTAISNSPVSPKVSGSADEKKTGNLAIEKIKHHHKRHHKHLHHR
jgi:hypothetical protein